MKVPQPLMASSLLRNFRFWLCRPWSSSQLHQTPPCKLTRRKRQTKTVVAVDTYCVNPNRRKKPSNGERRVSRLLDKMRLWHEIEAAEPNLMGTGGRLLRIDFMLRDYDIAIEFHGLQHYRCVSFWGGVHGFEQRVHHDLIKRCHLSSKGIHVIEVFGDREDLEATLQSQLRLWMRRTKKRKPRDNTT